MELKIIISAKSWDFQIFQFFTLKKYWLDFLGHSSPGYAHIWSPNRPERSQIDFLA